MAEIVWTLPAFRSLETLPESIAFGIIRQTDLLRRFPEMGSPLLARFKSLRAYRQLVFHRRFRVVYRYDQLENCVFICAVQNCRQKLPTARQLKRAEKEGDSPHGE